MSDVISVRLNEIDKNNLELCKIYLRESTHIDVPNSVIIQAAISCYVNWLKDLKDLKEDDFILDDVEDD